MLVVFARAADRDVSERIALGKAVPKSKDSMFDQRLFNQDDGMASGRALSMISLLSNFACVFCPVLSCAVLCCGAVLFCAVLCCCCVNALLCIY